MAVTRSVSISREFDDLLDKYELSPSECMRVGISVILAERGHIVYNNKLNTERRIEELRTLLRLLESGEEKADIQN